MTSGFPDKSKLRPLSEHAWSVLEGIRADPLPTSCYNPGVLDRLTREGLIAIEMRPSPFKAHNGGNIQHAVITDAGRVKLADGAR